MKPKQRKPQSKIPESYKLRCNQYKDKIITFLTNGTARSSSSCLLHKGAISRDVKKRAELQLLQNSTKHTEEGREEKRAYWGEERKLLLLSSETDSTFLSQCDDLLTIPNIGRPAVPSV